MDYKKYQIIYAPDVLEKLKEIRDYISQNYSSTSGQRKMEQIISDIEKLEVFPEVGFDADEKYGSKISHYHSTKGYTLSKDYIVLYHIEGEENRVVIDYLLPTQSDYIKHVKSLSSLARAFLVDYQLTRSKMSSGCLVDIPQRSQRLRS